MKKKISRPMVKKRNVTKPDQKQVDIKKKKKEKIQYYILMSLVSGIQIKKYLFSFFCRKCNRNITYCMPYHTIIFQFSCHTRLSGSV